jgi:hypothetical protein
MKTLRGTFDNLVSTMKRYDIYQKDDEVGMELNELSNLIDEVEKRMQCVIKTNKDCKGIISIYEDVISFDDFEILERSTNDIDIAMDLTDDEAITNDWYGLFAPKDDEEIVPRETWIVTQLANETDISVDDVVKVAMDLGMNPSIEEINEVLKYYNSVAEETTETWVLVVENLLYNCVVPSQQTIEDKFKPRSVAEYVATLPKEEPPTFLCYSDDIHNVVKDVISKLKDIQVDGETMQYILEQVGMEEQMLSQLMYSFAKT